MTDAQHKAPAPNVERGEDLRATLRLTSQGKIIGHHPSFREAVITVERAATSNCTVHSCRSGNTSPLATPGRRVARSASWPRPNATCEAEVTAGLFREGLFYRINVVRAFERAAMPRREPPATESPRSVIGAGPSKDFETSLTLQALHRTGDNRHHAAQVLRMNRTTLIEKIRRKRLGA
jgi:Bacterial regulatory protein, Fis family